jgi:hypothetical protein
MATNKTAAKTRAFMFLPPSKVPPRLDEEPLGRASHRFQIQDRGPFDGVQTPDHEDVLRDVYELGFCDPDGVGATWTAKSEDTPLRTVRVPLGVLEKLEPAGLMEMKNNENLGFLFQILKALHQLGLQDDT